MPDFPIPRPDASGDEPDFEQLLLAMLGGDLASNPQMASAMQAAGLDKVDPAQLSMIAASVQAMMAPTDGSPFNVDLARDVARKTAAAGGDASIDGAQRHEVEQAVQVANLWLDQVTDFAAPSTLALTWSRAEWVEQTMPVWTRLVEPVAQGVGKAVEASLREQLGALGEGGMSELFGSSGDGEPGPANAGRGFDPAAVIAQMEPMLARMSSSMFGVQVGQALGTLAGEVVSGDEVGLPLVPGNAVALLSANLRELAQGLSIDESQVRLYLAVREASRVRLFAEVPWLGAQLVEAVQAYARDISIDTEAISSGVEDALGRVDPADPTALQSVLSESLFTPEPSSAQRVALGRLETYLALVEGWVDVVTERATSAHLPGAAALGETVRRRRASGGPAERVFSQLVGLQLRPRRMRDAANLWAALEAARGPAARDAAWAHPDIAPTAADLDDPIGFVQRTDPALSTSDDMDAAIDQLLAGGDLSEPAEQGDDPDQPSR